jgi:hypothetical protein
MELSRRRTGKTYRELHEWMDPWEEDRALARERHEITNIPENFQYVREKWGEEGAREFLFHIKEDLEHKASKSIFKRVWRKIFS